MHTIRPITSILPLLTIHIHNTKSYLPEIYKQTPYGGPENLGRYLCIPGDPQKKGDAFTTSK